MTFALRSYQSDLIDKARVALREVPRVLIQSPTGSGKTALTAHMLGTAASKGRRSFFIVHRQELIEQSIATFETVGISTGVIAAGYRGNPFAPVQIASIDTLKNRLDKVTPPDLIVWDECHHVAAAGWARVMAAYPRALHVGLTATPWRLDGSGLGAHFDRMIKGPSVAWLIEQGFLSPYRAFAPSNPDLGNVHSRAGDYVPAELETVMGQSAIVGDAVAHYRRLAGGKRAVAGCVSIKPSQAVAAQFKAAGVMAYHLDGTTPRVERRAAIKAFRDGHINVLTNVDLFGEGFDLPAIEAAILLRPTKSLALYLQQVGRALRPYPGKSHAIILDHAANIAAHGLPDEPREWSLEARERKRGGKSVEPNFAIRQCPRCYTAHRPAPACPSCSHVYEQAGRNVEQIDGELAEIDPAIARRAKAREQARAETLDQLIALARARGYKNPEKWAGYVWTARQAKGRAA
jgi:DNA repair protein RadD